MQRFARYVIVALFSLILIFTVVAPACAPAVPATLPPAVSVPAAPAKLPPTPAGMINSALGPISPDKLGQTLIHEHFAFAYPGWTADDSIAPYDRQAVIDNSLKIAQLAKSVGIQTIVDPTPNDCGGRDPLVYKEVSKQTGVNIICTTGLYFEKEGSPAYWESRVAWGVDLSKMISELFIKEITEGIGATGVKAGAIKVGTSPVMTDYEKLVHKAAIIAQKATGVPIITHTEGPTGGVEQAEFLITNGADPKKVMIGHVTNSKDIEYHRAILAKGVKVGFDRLGLAVLYGVPDDLSVKNIATLVKDNNYGDRILLSHDTVNLWLGRSLVKDVPEKAMPLFKDWRIDHVSKDILPMLKAQGLTDDQINTIMVGNARNLFLGK
ncbi:MAG: phosphotriesterase-related protein [Chloroflexi bacterium]|nr:phosphotriesterase-related protein [Chloroflexota bacterium]